MEAKSTSVFNKATAKGQEYKLFKEYRSHIIDLHPIKRYMVEDIVDMDRKNIKEILYIMNDVIQNLIENIG